ncbi:MAG TPA: hypothetical protein VG077_06680 [Verrucomicrobiae bacterium]|nr:hypothetical protein [Verrucomicrobiae bacterium]
MKRTSPPQFEVAALNTTPGFDDDGFKDVFFPIFEVMPGETPIAFKLRFIFACGGYRVIKVEEVATHPVVVIRAVRKDARRVADHRLFFRHIRHILSQAGFRIRQGELIIDQTGDRVLVSFLWRNSLAQFNEAMPVLEGEFDPIP